MQRRRLVMWCDGRKQGPLDSAMQASLEISTSAAGAFVHRHADTQNRWSKISGSRCRGRYAVASTRSNVAAEDVDNVGVSILKKPTSSTALDDDVGISQPELTRQASWETPVGEVADSAFVGVELDLQLGQMTLRNRHLSALKPEILQHPDMKTVFGACGTIQASQLSQAIHCEVSSAFCFWNFRSSRSWTLRFGVRVLIFSWRCLTSRSLDDVCCMADTSAGRFKTQCHNVVHSRKVNSSHGRSMGAHLRPVGAFRIRELGCQPV